MICVIAAATCNPLAAVAAKLCLEAGARKQAADRPANTGLVHGRFCAAEAPVVWCWLERVGVGWRALRTATGVWHGRMGLWWRFLSRRTVPVVLDRVEHRRRLAPFEQAHAVRHNPISVSFVVNFPTVGGGPGPVLI